MKKNKDLEIAYISGNDFIPYLSISILSLIENNINYFNKIIIHILDRGISPENKNLLIELIRTFKPSNEFEIEIKYHEISNLEEILGIKNKKTSNFITSINTYSRLLISSVLPKNTDKVIYLDGDSIIKQPLLNIWEENIDDYYIAGVLDPLADYIKVDIGLSKKDPYINGGFLIINLKKWRDERLENKIIDYIDNNKSAGHYMDQDVLNKVLKDKIKVIPPKYNVLSIFYELSYENILQYSDINEYYSKELFEESLKNPVFLHFASTFYGRPWYKKPKNRFYEEYKKYAEIIPWKNLVYVDDSRSILQKIAYKLNFILPTSLIISFFKIIRKFNK